MAKRFLDTELWDKVWFMNLDCRLKCLVKMVRDKADLCGVWSPNWIIASTYIGKKITEKDLLSIDGGNQFKKLENGKIYCIGFVEFQYGELSEKSPVHRKIISMLQQNGILDTYKIIATKYPIDRVQEEEEDKEEEMVKEMEEEKDSPAEFKNPFPITGIDLWQGWKNYKWEEHHEKYKAVKTEQAAVDKLFELARGNPDDAKKIIEQSIANRWKGLFELKTQKNGTTKSQHGFTREGINAVLKNRFSKDRQAGSESVAEEV